MARPVGSGRHHKCHEQGCLPPTMMLGREGAPRPDRNGPGSFKRRRGSQDRRQGGRARTRLRRLGPPRSPPISHSAEWPRAFARGIALRCSSAATARCDGVREDTRNGARPGRATFARPPRAHAPVAVPTWRGAIGSLFAMCDRVGSTRKQRLTAYGCPLCRTTRRIIAHIIVRLRGTQGMRVPDRRRTATPGRGAPCRPVRAEGMGTPQKLTRPDGEIRAGRVDRRRGSGGRERRSGL
jgi:hypothetical protein